MKATVTVQVRVAFKTSPNKRYSAREWDEKTTRRTTDDDQS